MKKLFFIFYFLFFIFNTQAQNLVPNHSFEAYDTCPYTAAQIRFAFPWVDPTNTSSDYFNSCSGTTGPQGVPSNNFGTQNAKDGNGYAGFVAFANSISNYREYIQVKLIDTLKSNICYRLIFYVSIAEREMYGVNTLSAYFSTTAISGSPMSFLAVTPQFIYSDTLIGNDTTWYKVEGTFIAAGGEQYMTIGNFKTDAQTIVTLVNPSGLEGGAYYYIDDISLTLCSGLGVEEFQVSDNFKLYPNPNDGNMTLEYTINECCDAVLTIYDVSGRVVMQKNINTENKKEIINAEMLNAGLYYYDIKVANRKVKTDKIIIIK